MAWNEAQKKTGKKLSWGFDFIPKPGPIFWPALDKNNIMKYHVHGASFKNARIN